VTLVPSYRHGAAAGEICARLSEFEVFDQQLEWKCEGATDAFVLDVIDYFARVFDA
jgi:hypothetical protein